MNADSKRGGRKMNSKIRVTLSVVFLLALTLLWSFFYGQSVLAPLNFVLDVFTVVILIITTYTSVIKLFGFIRPKKYAETDKITRFAVITSARNEERVIGKLIDSIHEQNYPRDAYDIFVIADNCTDATAEVARSMGAIVYERHDTQRVGKGYALNWFFERFNAEHAKNYDAVAVFDADNLLDRNFLYEMNKVLASGESAAMGYRDSKNPHDNWIAGGTAIGFWNMVRFYYNARSSVGLSALYGGTGYVFRCELVSDGWHTYTITEDTEFSMLTIARGIKIAFCYAAVFFDEQPTNLRISIRQRYRWSVGKQDCVRYCTRPLSKTIFSRNFFLGFDGWMRIMFPLATSIRVVLAVMEGAASSLSKLWGGMDIGTLVTTFISPKAVILGALAGALGMMLEALVIILIEKKDALKMWKTVLLYPIHNSISAVLTVLAFFYRDRTWRRIPHERSLSVSEIQK